MTTMICCCKSITSELSICSRCGIFNGYAVTRSAERTVALPPLTMTLDYPPPIRHAESHMMRRYARVDLYRAPVPKIAVAFEKENIPPVMTESCPVPVVAQPRPCPGAMKIIIIPEDTPEAQPLTQEEQVRVRAFCFFSGSLSSPPPSSTPLTWLSFCLLHQVLLSCEFFVDGETSSVATAALSPSSSSSSSGKDTADSSEQEREQTIEREVDILKKDLVELLSHLCSSSRKKIQKCLAEMRMSLRCVIAHVQPLEDMCTLQEARIATGLVSVLSQQLCSASWPDWLHNLDPSMLYNNDALRDLLRCFMRSVWEQPASYRVLSAMDTVRALKSMVTGPFLDSFMDSYQRAVKMQLSTCSQNLIRCCENHIGLLHIFAAPEKDLVWKKLAMIISSQQADDITSMSRIMGLQQVLLTTNIRKHSKKHGRIIAEIAIRKRFQGAKFNERTLNLMCSADFETLAGLARKIDGALLSI